MADVTAERDELKVPFSSLFIGMGLAMRASSEIDGRTRTFSSLFIGMGLAIAPLKKDT